MFDVVQMTASPLPATRCVLHHWRGKVDQLTSPKVMEQCPSLRGMVIISEAPDMGYV